MSRKSGTLIYLEPLGPPRPVVGDLYLFYLSMEPATCHPFGIKDFEVAYTFLEYLWTPHILQLAIYSSYSNIIVRVLANLGLRLMPHKE